MATESVQIVIEEKISIFQLMIALSPHDVYIEKGDIVVDVYESDDSEEEITRLLNKAGIRAFVEQKV